MKAVLFVALLAVAVFAAVAPGDEKCARLQGRCAIQSDDDAKCDSSTEKMVKRKCMSKPKDDDYRCCVPKSGKAVKKAAKKTAKKAAKSAAGNGEEAAAADDFAVAASDAGEDEDDLDVDDKDDEKDIKLDGVFEAGEGGDQYKDDFAEEEFADWLDAAAAMEPGASQPTTVSGAVTEDNIDSAYNLVDSSPGDAVLPDDVLDDLKDYNAGGDDDDASFGDSLFKDLGLDEGVDENSEACAAGDDECNDPSKLSSAKKAELDAAEDIANGGIEDAEAALDEKFLDSVSGAGPVQFPPEHKYYDTSRYNVKTDARIVCDAMKGWGVDEAKVNRIVLSYRRSYDYLQKLKREFKYTRCKSSYRGDLVKWIKDQFTCEEEVKLVEALTSRSKKRAQDLEKWAVDTAEATKKNPNIGDAREVEQSMIDLSHKETDSLMATCGKGLLKGVKDAVMGYVNIAKMGWKAMVKVFTDPVGAAKAVGCAVKRFGRWLWKKTKSTASWIKNKSVSFVKNAWNSFKKWAKKPCVTGPLLCVFEKALRAPFDLMSWALGKVIAAFSFVMRKTIGKFWYEVSTSKKVRIICWLVGMFALELALIPVAPYVFGLIARKLATIATKVIPFIARIMSLGAKGGRVAAAARWEKRLRATVVGRWTAKHHLKAVRLKQAKLGKKMAKAEKKMVSQASKRGSKGTGVTGKRAASKNANKYNKAAAKHADLEKIAIKHQKVIAGGLKKRARAMNAKLDKQLGNLRQLQKKAPAGSKQRAAVDAQIKQMQKLQRSPFLSNPSAVATKIPAEKAAVYYKKFGKIYRSTMSKSARMTTGPVVFAKQVGKLKAFVKRIGSQITKRAPLAAKAASNAMRIGSSIKSAAIGVARFSVKYPAKAAGWTYKWGKNKAQLVWSYAKKTGSKLKAKVPPLKVKIAARPFPRLLSKPVLKKTGDKVLVQFGKVKNIALTGKRAAVSMKSKLVRNYASMMLRFEKAKAIKLWRVARKQASQAKDFAKVTAAAQKKVADKVASTAGHLAKAKGPKKLYYKTQLYAQKRQLKKFDSIASAGNIAAKATKKNVAAANSRIYAASTRQKAIANCATGMKSACGMMFGSPGKLSKMSAKMTARLKRVSKTRMMVVGVSAHQWNKQQKEEARKEAEYLASLGLGEYDGMELGGDGSFGLNDDGTPTDDDWLKELEELELEEDDGVDAAADEFSKANGGDADADADADAAEELDVDAGVSKKEKKKGKQSAEKDEEDDLDAILAGLE